MDLRYLRSFAKIAELRHVGRAADELGIAQPSLSYQLARLEESLHTTLFRRIARGVELTAAGRVLLDEIVPILKRIDELPTRIAEAAAGRTGTLTVGVVAGALLSGVASRMIREYRTQYPRVTVRVRAVLHVPLVQMLRDGTVDLAIFGSALGDTSFIGIPIARETFVVALPVDHHLATRRRVRYADLTDETLVTLAREASPALFARTVTTCAKHGFTPAAIEEALSEDAVMGLVAAGAGVAVVPDSWSAIRLAGVVTSKLSPAGEGSPLRLFRRAADRSPLVHAFVACSDRLRPLRN